MLKNIDQYYVIAEVMREHHEKYNGSGYPRGLKENEIQPLSRIMILADAFDAMTTNRVYKPRKSLDVAFKELQELSAIHFHPDVVSASLIALKDIDIDATITQLPESIVEKQRFSYFYKDRLTNLFIMDYLELILRYYVKTPSIYLYEINLHGFSKYNKELGWSKGDEFLVEFAHFLENRYKNTIVFRVEGDDFMILSEDKIESFDENIGSCPLLSDSIITYSTVEKYVEDVSILI